VLDR
jgi:hypothetical protein